jgi:N-acetylmuramoyl-L-alanine amidase
MIDPGHGGSNAGALGTTGLREKDLTLTLALQVKARLATQGIVARLTRERDETLTLRQRVAAANTEAVDLFVSIHANASPTRTQRGHETYVLTSHGVDVDARALRADAVTPRPGIDRDIALVLDDVERGAVQWESAELAVAIQSRLSSLRGAAASRGVRQDAHHVLLGATMPAVLVEVGFIDHPIEGQELAQPELQDALAAAIADGIASQLPPITP